MKYVFRQYLSLYASFERYANTVIYLFITGPPEHIKKSRRLFVPLNNFWSLGQFTVNQRDDAPFLSWGINVELM